MSCSVSIGSDFSLLSSQKINWIKKIESVKFFLQELAANTLMGYGNLQKAVTLPEPFAARGKAKPDHARD